MCIWISRIAVAVVAIGLTACVQDYGAGRTAPILDGGLTVGMPQGYCLDGTASRQSGDSAVILMGRCNTSVDAAPAVLTLSVGPAGSASAISGGGQMLADFFSSASGRATLSRDGRSGDVTVKQAVQAQNAFVMRVQDRAVGEYWRAITGLRGRLVTLSVAGTDDTPLSAQDGRALLDATLAQLVKANPPQS